MSGLRRGAPGLLALMLLGCSASAADIATRPNETAHNRQNFDEIQRGRYLATLSDCTGCHTKPEGGAFMAGGYPIETPFGKLISPNITPDKDTGIGAWSDDQFVDAVQHGRARDGAHLYPAMPYTAYVKMPREDVLAIRAYLATIPPVRNSVVSNQLPFPFRIRASMIAWNWLFFDDEPFRGDPKKSAEWNRGAYLVAGPAHCGVCHNDKNFLGGDKSNGALRGTVIQGWEAPDLTQDRRTGLAHWTVDDIVAYLKTGHNRISAASGPMAEVIRDSTSQMHDDDLQAIATFVKDQAAPQQQSASAIAQSDPAMKEGQAIYVDACSACHARDGSGAPNIFPALKNSPIVQSTDPTTLARVVLHGTQNVATPEAPTGPAMPAFGWKLTDQQAAAVLTYIRNAWGNAAAAVTAGQVNDLRSPSG
ncbi:MAG TPA: cytochrome c [Stellaceae bacterium]|nr:cytochrome c [Stellaceae bacterium]